MAACLRSQICVAVDLGPVGCTLHINSSDLTSAYNASGFTQFVLNRICLPTTARSTTTNTTVTTDITRPIGNDAQEIVPSYLQLRLF